MNELPPDVDSAAANPPEQFGLRRLLELPILLAAFYWLGATLGIGAAAAMAVLTVSVVGYRSSGKTALYACLLFVVIILAGVSGARRTSWLDGAKLHQDATAPVTAASAKPVQTDDPVAIASLQENQAILLRDGEGRVRSVHLFGEKIRDSSLQHLKKLDRLERLKLWHTAITDVGLAQLEGLPRLATLDIEENSFTDAGLAHLSKIAGLTNLYLSGNAIGDRGLTFLEDLTELGSLSLKNTQVTNAGLSHLRKMTKLRSLDLSKTQIGDEGLSQLQGMTELNGLLLDETKVSDAGLAHLKRMQKLRELYLRKTRVTDAGMVHLLGLKQLRWLFLDQCNIGDQAIGEVSNLPSLERLSVTQSRVTDAGLVHLKKVKSLEEVSVGGTRVSDQGVQGILEALPRCKVYGRPGNSTGRPQRLPLAGRLGSRLAIRTPDKHVFNISADHAQLGSTGSRYHDILVSERQMSQLFGLLDEKHKVDWQDMSAESPYPAADTVLSFYGAGPPGQNRLHGTLGDAKTAVPILEEIVTCLPESAQAIFQSSLERMTSTKGE